MFDYIRCEALLPLNKKEQKLFKHVDWKDEGFQTKELDNTLSTYIIKSDGKLVAEIIKGKNVRVISEEEEKKIKRKNKFCWPYKFEVTSKKIKHVKHTGKIYFYHIINDIDGNRWWLEFVGTFVDGLLKGKLKKVKSEIHMTKTEQDKQDRKFKEMLDKEEKKIHRRISKTMNAITANYWRYFWFAVGRGLRNFGQKVSRLDIFINRYIA